MLRESRPQAGGSDMFARLEEIFSRPKPFQCFSASELWTDEHTSKKMLEYHLDENVDVSSRNKEFIDKSVNWIVSHFHVGPDTKIADFGCGPGLYTTRLAQKKAKVLGIDFSKRSIEYAKAEACKQNLSIEYVNQNYLDFHTNERFDLVLMIMCDFCALSPEQRKKMLGKFHEYLNPAGAVLLDVYSLHAYEQREEQTSCEVNLLDGFWSSNRYYGILNTHKYEAECVILDKFTIVESNRERTIYNWIQYYDPDDLRREFSENGFRIDELYGDVAGSSFDQESSEFAVVARKMGT